jgi:hypothetical protein
MAEIKMDVSEYEAMKENASLLKEALGREKELGEQIKKLNQEKIQALEKIPNKVVHTITQNIYEEVCLQKDPREIAYNMLRVLERTLGQRIEVPTYTRLSSASLVDVLGAEISHNLGFFFEKKTNKTIPIETHEYIGFEDVRAQVKKHFEKNLDKTTTSILESYPEVKNKLFEVERSLKSLQTQHDKVLNENFNLLEEKKKYLEELEAQKKSIEDFEEAKDKFLDKLKSKVFLGFVSFKYVIQLLTKND